MRAVYLLIATCFWTLPLASATSPRAVALAREIRCPVCGAQSLADSEAPLALELRHQIDLAVAQGASDSEILAAFAERYGDDVILTPPFKATTWLLWGAPFGVFSLGLAFLMWRMRRVYRKTRGPHAR